MTNSPDLPPDRLSISPQSPHFKMELLQRGIGIRFKGTVRTDVVEYCISEEWVRIQAGNSRDRKGNPLTVKRKGPVSAWFEDIGEEPNETPDEEPGEKITEEPSEGADEP